ncbi:MAG: substrate-binding domain-containing protein, partial [bacterium]
MLIVAGTALAAAKDVALVSHKANAVTTVSLAELVKICKGQMNHWPDGKPLTLVTRDPGSPDMKLVLEKVYGMSKAEVAEVISTANHGRLNHPAILVAGSDTALV